MCEIAVTLLYIYMNREWIPETSLLEMIKFID